MVKVKRVLVATYGRALRKLNVARKHFPHDRLVIVCDPGAKELGDLQENEEERGGEFVHVEVDPYDFTQCLTTCDKVLASQRGKEVTVNISCGPKTLVGAMLFAAFHSDVEVYHCDLDRMHGKELVIRLPTMKEFELRKRFSRDDWGIIGLLGKARTRSFLLKRTELGDTVLDRALLRLERDGVLEEVLKKGVLWIEPTPMGSFFYQHSYPDLEK